MRVGIGGQRGEEEVGQCAATKQGEGEEEAPSGQAPQDDFEWEVAGLEG